MKMSEEAKARLKLIPEKKCYICGTPRNYTNPMAKCLKCGLNFCFSHLTTKLGEIAQRITAITVYDRVFCKSLLEF